MILISATLVAHPVLSVGRASPEPVPIVGQVIQSSQASLRGYCLVGGGTLLEDDVLETAKGGRALVELVSKVQAVLGEATKVQFRRAGGRAVAGLDAGTLIARQNGSETLRIETANFSVEPEGQRSALYMVTFLPGRETLVAANSGRVVITDKASGERFSLPAGKYATVAATPGGFPAVPQEKEESRPAPDQPSGPATVPPKPGWRIGSLSPGASAGLVAALGSGGAAAAAIPALSGGDQSPSPTR